LAPSCRHLSVGSAALNVTEFATVEDQCSALRRALLNEKVERAVRSSTQAVSARFCEGLLSGC
jgi:hypothetical protein